MNTDKNQRRDGRRNYFFPCSLMTLNMASASGACASTAAEFGLVQNLREAGEGVEVFLKLTLGDEEKHDEVYRLVVEGVKVDAAAGTAQSADDFGDQIRRGVGDADAEADARAHGGLALFDGRGDGVAILGLDFSGGDQVVDQFVNRFPAGGGLQIREDLVFG